MADQSKLSSDSLSNFDDAPALPREVQARQEVDVEPNDVTLPGSPPTPIRVAFRKGYDGERRKFFQNCQTSEPKTGI
jgi:hypothetical protein